METSQQQILIVDDDPRSLITLEHMLRETGADIVEAGSGRDALAACEDHDFALAILDIHMPEMSGYELAERMRSDARTCRVPLIFVTGSEADENLEFKGYAAGAVAFIRKPATPQILVAKAKVFLELHGQRSKLEHAAREWQTTFDGITDLVALVTPDRHILQCNQAMCDFLQMTHDEVCGQRCTDLMHGSAGTPDACPLTRVLASKEKETMLFPVGDRTLEVIVHPVFDVCGEVTSAVHIVRDITEQKRAEAELQVFNASMVAREMRIVEVKKEANALARELGRELPYPPVWEEGGMDAEAMDNR